MDDTEHGTSQYPGFRRKNPSCLRSISNLHKIKQNKLIQLKLQINLFLPVTDVGRLVNKDRRPYYECLEKDKTKIRSFLVISLLHSKPLLFEDVSLQKISKFIKMNLFCRHITESGNFNAILKQRLYYFLNFDRKIRNSTIFKLPGYLNEYFSSFSE